MAFPHGGIRKSWVWSSVARYVKWVVGYLFDPESLEWHPWRVHHTSAWPPQGDPLSPMLFILVMDTLNFLISQATVEGLRQPLSSRSIQHWLSLYADDVVLFLRLVASDIDITASILELFGEATGLRTNVQKSNVTPIHCLESDLMVVQERLPCRVDHFPVKYLGLPLTIKKNSLRRSCSPSLIGWLTSSLDGRLNS